MTASLLRTMDWLESDGFLVHTAGAASFQSDMTTPFAALLGVLPDRQLGEPMALELQPGRHEWKIGDSTWHPPGDAEFLELVLKSGHTPWVGTGGSFGGKSASREVFVIYRGRTLSHPRQQMWEICLIEDDLEVSSYFVCDILSSCSVSLAWLSGESTEQSVELLERLRVTKQSRPEEA